MPGCGFCSAERGLLKGLRVPFREVVVNDKEKLSQVVKLSGQTGTPVLVVGRKVVVGYSQSAVKRALGIRKKR